MGSKREEARKEAEKLLKKEDNKMRNIIIATIAVIVIGLISWTIMASSNSAKNNEGKEDNVTSELTSEGQITPKKVDENGAFLIVSENVKEDSVRVDNFFDPICPGCGAVDRELGEVWAEQVDNGDISLYLTPVAFLDQMSADFYSTRAANAFVTVYENEDSKVALDFLHEIYTEDNQPMEGANYKSVSDADLGEIAVSVGASEETAEKIEKQLYVEWVMENADKQINRKDLFPQGFSTPSVFVHLKYVNGAASGTKVEFLRDKPILDSYLEVLPN